MAVNYRVDASYPALIVKANRGMFHHGSVGIARTLGRLGVPVYAVTDDAYTPLAASRYLTRAFVWDDGAAGPESFRREMAKIGAAIGRPTVLYPIDDLSAALVSENARFLSRQFVFPQARPDIVRQMADKASFSAFCDRIGIATAMSLIPGNSREVREFADRTGFPVVMKAVTQWALVEGLKSTTIVRNRQQLDEICKILDRADFPGVLLQEFIPGEDWIYHGYRTSRAHSSLSFSGRKLLSYPPEFRRDRSGRIRREFRALRKERAIAGGSFLFGNCGYGLAEG